MKRKKTKQFIAALLVVLAIALVVMAKVMIGGAIDEYHIPLRDWSAAMLAPQLFMIAVYSMVFTGLLAIPLWYWFLGEPEHNG